MKLADLLQNIDVLEIHADLQTELTAVISDSRRVIPGSLFVAVSGFASDGNRFIPMAMEKGALVDRRLKMRLVSTKMGIPVDRRLKIRLVSMEMGILVDRRPYKCVVSTKTAIFVDKTWCYNGNRG